MRTSLTSNNFKVIQRQCSTSTISVIGYNKTWQLTLRYGNHQYSGLQIKHLEVEALITKIKVVQSLIRK